MPLGIFISNKGKIKDVVKNIFQQEKKNRVDILSEKAEQFIENDKTYDYISHKGDEKSLFHDLTEDIKKQALEKLKGYKGIVIILGPDYKKNTDGANIRKALKEELQKHIQKKYGNKSKFEVCYPEEAEEKPDPVNIDVVKMMMLDNKVKLIFGVWEKGAVGLIAEVHCITEHKNISLKAKIFVDEKLWGKSPYIIRGNHLKILHQVFNGVYPEDFKVVKNITKKAIQIFDGYCKWAADHNDEWLGDE